MARVSAPAIGGTPIASLCYYNYGLFDARRDAVTKFAAIYHMEIEGYGTTDD